MQENPKPENHSFDLPFLWPLTPLWLHWPRTGSSTLQAVLPLGLCPHFLSSPNILAPGLNLQVSALTALLRDAVRPTPPQKNHPPPPEPPLLSLSLQAPLRFLQSTLHNL